MSNAIAVQGMYVHKFINPGAVVDNAAFTSYCLDMQGKKSVMVLVHIGATDIAHASLKVQESDTLSSSTALSSGADITGADFSVSPATLPTSTADNTVVAVSIPWTGSRKRYCNIVSTAGDGAAGTYMTALGICEVDESKGTAAADGMNVTQLLKVAG